MVNYGIGRILKSCCLLFVCGLVVWVSRKRVKNCKVFVTESYEEREAAAEFALPLLLVAAAQFVAACEIIGKERRSEFFFES